MDDVTFGVTAAKPSQAVFHATQGLYSIAHLGVYCREFKGDVVTIGRTVFKLAMDLGWNSLDPTRGVEVVILGDHQFCNVMAELCRKFKMPYRVLRLPSDNDAAFEMLDHQFKGMTHYVEFCNLSQFRNELYSQMAFNYGVSQLRVVIP